MPFQFSPQELASSFDDSDNSPVTRESLLTFRDKLIRLLSKLQAKEISGTTTIAMTAVGASTRIFVDHSSQFSFNFSEQPRFAAIGGLDVTVLGMGTVGGIARSTNGAGFVVRVDNVSSATLAAGSVTLSWSRTGLRG